MKVLAFASKSLFLALVCGLLASPARSDDFTWDGGPLGTGTDVNDPLNWDPDGLPHLAAQTNNAHFAAVGSTSPTLGDTDFWVKQFFFDAGAQAYTFTGNSGPSTYVSIYNPGADALVNNSSQQQVMNITTGTIGIGGWINTGTAAGGSLVINGPLSVSDGSGSGASYLGLTGSNNVYFNVDTSINPAGDVNGGEWTSSTTTNMYGRARARFSIANFSGTAFLGNIGTSYLGAFHLDSTVNGALRLTHDNSLGAPGTGGNLDAVYIYGGTTGNATLELQGDISVTRGLFYLNGRSDAVADDPHILNVSGNNTINVVADWNTGSRVPITSTADNGPVVADAGNWNIQSDSGKLTLAGGNIYNTEDVATTLQLRGAGDGQIDAPIAVWSATPSLNIVKSGTGTWTLTNVPDFGVPPDTGVVSSFTGTTTIQQGTLSLGSTGSLATGGAITVNSGATFDVSGLFSGAYALGPTQTLAGSGSVVGNIITGFGSSIAPGNSVGTLTLSGASSNLTLDGGTLQFELTNNPLGANDKIVVGGGLTIGFGGTTTIAVNALDGALGNGSYRLIDYAGALNDFGSGFTLTGVGAGTTRQTFTVDTTVTQQVNLNVTGSAASLTWVGGNNANAWDLVNTVNWTGAPGPAFDNRFYDGDSVTFDDSGSNSPDINLVGTLSPATVTFSNTSAHNYTLSGTGDLAVTGAFSLTGSGTVTLANSGGVLTLPTITLNSGTLAVDRTDDLALSGTISGAGALRKEGTNTVTVSGDNSGFTGAITVADGTLQVDHGNINALGTAAMGTTVSNGATLDLNGTTLATEVVTIEGAGVGGIGALYDSRASGFGAADQSHINGVIMTGDATIGVSGNSVMYVDGAGASFQGNGHNLAVIVSNSPSGSEFDVIDTGDMNVNNIEVSGGAPFFIGGNTTLGPTSGTLTLQDSSSLGIYASLTGASASTATIDKPIVVASSVNGGGIEVYRGNKTIDSPITMNANLDVTNFTSTNNTTSTATLTGKLTGPGSLSVHTSASTTTSRLGLVELTNDGNDFTGPITIGGGGGLVGVATANDRISLSIGNGGSTGSIGPGDITITGVTTTNRVFLYFNRSGSYTIPNNIITAGPSLNRSRVDAIHPDGDVTLTGIISGNGRVDVTAGSMTLAGANTFAGVALADVDGQLVISNNDALGAVGDESNGYTQPLGGAGVTNALVLTNNITTGEFIWLGPRDTLAAHIKNRSGDNTIAGTIQADLLAGFHSYALQSDGTAPGDMFRISGNVQTPDGLDLGGASQLSFQGAGKGVVSGNIIEQFGNVWNVEKNDGGTWTFAGADSYTGTTNVNAGTLLVNGTHTGGGTYSVASGGTLGGTGAIGSAIVVDAGGVLAPGASVGTLSVAGNVSIDGTLAIEVSGANIDLLSITGGLTLGAASVLDIQGDLATAVAHVIATYDPGSLVGTFGDATAATMHGYNVVYENSQITLDELDGDANHDGVVNIFDINLVSANWDPTGPVGAFAPGNINHDTTVNIFDINLISANWNHVATNGGVAHAQPVPEPASIALASLGFLGLVTFARRRRK
jgi:fibronectin-binding autotransporter adhesin